MEVLIASSTTDEIAPAFKACSTEWVGSAPDTFTRGPLTVRFLITGVGMMRMAYALTRTLRSTSPDLCVNAGIAGAFPGKFDIGDTVHVVKEIAADLGAEDADGTFVTLKEMGLDEDISATEGLVNTNAAHFAFLPSATGVTVNKVLGTESSIQSVVTRFDPDVASMEGAAFFYCCLKEQVSFLSIRSISNIVAERDRSQWRLEHAVEALNGQLMEMFEMLLET